MTTLTLIRGIPGAGKSTLARKLRRGDAVHLEADMYFIDEFGNYKFDGSKLSKAHEWCQNECDDYLHYGVDVIVSNTFTTLSELRTYFHIAKKYNIVPLVILCQGNYTNIHNVPNVILDKMRKRFEYDISSLF